MSGPTPCDALSENTKTPGLFKRPALPPSGLFLDKKHVFCHNSRCKVWWESTTPCHWFDPPSGGHGKLQVGIACWSPSTPVPCTANLLLVLSRQRQPGCCLRLWATTRTRPSSEVRASQSPQGSTESMTSTPAATTAQSGERSI